MANTFTLQTAVYDSRYMKVVLTQTTDIEKNTSTINWTLSSEGGRTNWYATGPTTLTIGGQQAYYKARVGLREEFPTSKGSVSGSVVIPHNNEGQATVDVVLSTAIAVFAVSTYSGSWQLDTIPRGAKITSVANFTDEDNPNITYYSPAGNAVSSLRLGLSSNGSTPNICAYRPISISGTQYTLTLTQEEREKIWDLTIAAGAGSIPVYFLLETKIGSYTGVSSLEKICSIANPNPVMTLTAQDVNETTLALTGNPNKIIRGQSSVEYFLDSYGVKNAEIATRYITAGSHTGLTATGIIENIETDTIVYAVRDNRNIRVEKTHNLDIIEYFPVSCSYSASIKMSGETTAKATINMMGNFFNQSFGTTTNTLRLYIDYGNGWTQITTQPSVADGRYSLTYVSPEVPYDEDFVFKIKVEDKLTTTITNGYTLQVIPVFDWSKTDFNFNVPVSFNGQEMKDFVVDEGLFDGWTYRLWNSGDAECWRRLQITTPVNTAWGNMYSSGSLSSTNLFYPFDFKETPVLSVSLMPFGSGGLLMVPGNGYGNASQTGPFEITRGSALSSGQFLLAYYVKGKWR